MTDKKMLFIIGNPRSGTSLLRIMLTNHSLVCIPPECGFIQWWHGKYGDWSAKDSRNPARIKDYIDDLRTSRKIETWQLDFASLYERIEQERPEQYPSLCKIVIGHYAESHGRQVALVGDKNNYYVRHLDLLVRIFPDARFLCLIRDGRDVACSYKALKNVRSSSKYRPELPSDTSAIARQWTRNNENIVEKIRQEAAVSSKVIRFEDLVTDTSKTLTEVCDWLEIDLESRMLRYAESENGTNDEPGEFLAWKKKTLRKPDPSSIGKFRSLLSEAEVRQFELIAGKTLQKFDYPTETIG
ncbi:MAG: sulfotransferase [Acidobacteria bacterium]|nr:MAG: sulfotransferase [Acidobacteriota bacterium]REJ99080.1 MAG: sulfotransferase [Acidobacteriota bacterium]REK16200.1 MAG: sulfotransferase [Acidobacteriota bacterium]REK43881.1 MAG: sulfotransferase [Acidobacteriota bacterium]